MAAIQKLSPEIISQIAAGEVVERPASAVKELVENAMDAGARNITVELREGGISYIRVTDNGCGIPPEQIRLAFERHATSKLRSVEDLFNLNTLGFRGEALASIAAVAKVTLTTAVQGASFGAKAVVEGGRFLSIDQAASPVGTSIVVENLFSCVPARLRFLKKPATEASYVAEYVNSLILSRPDISFRFIHQGKTLCKSPGDGKSESAASCILGRETFSGMKPVSGVMNGVAISGFVGVGEQARGNHKQQYFFINRRYFGSSLLNRAVDEACNGRVMIGRFPSCVLYLDMPASKVDVNVHPNKLQVRFANENAVYEAVRQILQDALSGDALGKRLESALKPQTAPLAEKAAVSPRIEIVPVGSTLQRKTGERHSASDVTVVGSAAVADTGNGPALQENGKNYRAAGTAPIAGNAAPASRPVNYNAPALQENGKDYQIAETAPNTGNAAPASRPVNYNAPALQENGKDYRVAETAPNAGNAAPASRPVNYNALALQENGKNYQIAGTAPNTGNAAPASRPVNYNTPALQENGKAYQFSTAMPTPGYAASSAAPAGCISQGKQEKAAEDCQVQQQLPLSDSEESLPKLRYIGSAFNTYLIFEGADRVLVLDQHAAHERILYDKYMAQITAGKASQYLLSPQIIRVGTAEMLHLKELLPVLGESGFDISIFDENSVALRAIPMLFGVEATPKDLLLEAIDGWEGGKKQISLERVQRRIAQMACKHAIKGGDALNPSQVDAFLELFMQSGSCPTCPHGRPIVIEITKKDIEKRFSRIQS